MVSPSQPNGFLVATDRDYYQPNKTCRITLQAENGYKLTIRFMEINIYNKKTEDDSKDSRSQDESKDSKMKCTEDRLQVKGEKDSGGLN